ncbi:amidoligase family protein [Psychromarinibacter sp. C21-152]|uniref:Amidoligase family protein n=1 Tax=Psychromarinibacter sediminicola TaxID=3033385 RepID=A0AAE3NX55_9RHOB|nr:amidoligase family protein [Psychromarinibacter sediminicola]MDF0602267.1 amidoligase family protein [Psychromarinibacter sediminicola]
MYDHLHYPPAFDREGFAPLPGWDGRDGAARKAGIEIEFGGLSEREAAERLRRDLGGDLSPAGERAFRLTGSDLGDLDIYLDTALRNKLSGAVAEAGFEAGRAVIPVEIVTRPLAQADLPRLESVLRELHAAGAVGTRGGVFLGFGVHLNPELADPAGADVPAVATAFAFLEEWFRQTDPVDFSRRLLPFTDRYPPSLLDALAARDATPDRDAFIEIYLDHIQSRNYGLDLLPIVRHLAPDRFEAALGPLDQVGARPAYHYRLPDSRIGDPDWTLAYEWNRWALVERAARSPRLLDAFRQAWRARNWLLNRVRGGWAAEADGCLRAAGLHPGSAQ